MRKFEVYKHAVLGTEAIKRGFCWPALFIPFIWMLFRLLWRQAAIWTLCVIGASIFLSATEEAHSLPGKLMFALAVTIDLGVWLAPAVQGNRWRAEALVSRGYDLQVTLEAHSARDALEQVGAQQSHARDVRNARA